MEVTLASHLTMEECYTTLAPATWPVQDVAAPAMVGANGRQYKSMVWRRPRFTQDYETSSKATCIYCTATRRLWPVAAVYFHHAATSTEASRLHRWNFQQSQLSRQVGCHTIFQQLLLLSSAQ